MYYYRDCFFVTVPARVHTTYRYIPVCTKNPDLAAYSLAGYRDWSGFQSNFQMMTSPGRRRAGPAGPDCASAALACHADGPGPGGTGPGLAHRPGCGPGSLPERHS
jgi:hypothetical protein